MPISIDNQILTHIESIITKISRNEIEQKEINSLYDECKTALSKNGFEGNISQEELKKELYPFRNALMHDKVDEVAKAIVLRQKISKLDPIIYKLAKTFEKIEKDASDQDTIAKTVGIGTILLNLEDTMKSLNEELNTLYHTLDNLAPPKAIQDYLTPLKGCVDCEEEKTASSQ